MKTSCYPCQGFVTFVPSLFYKKKKKEKKKEKKSRHEISFSTMTELVTINVLFLTKIIQVWGCVFML